ncbi:sulfatase [Haloferax sp. Atlit-12N]|uniref:sulfatase n=1 Tax=Haloferax sp. Atlit-12N TaxID=2077203 RepID=UPI000E26B163|nr:sulfatase [Haloferax sp. Atlit-12N]RDZ64322.1 sulfatase [Haloferax sp. Atlit-12N]
MSENIVLVVMDTARASDTRFVRKNTPGSTLETLANEGSDFTHAYANAPWTLPSHTSMFTGTYTSKHGTHAGHKRYDGKFPTVAELLSESGYDTIGITNNAWVTDEFGLASGFDEFYKVWQYIQSDTDFGEIKLTSNGTELIKKGLSELFSKDILANLANGIYGQFFYRRNDYGAQRTNALVQKHLEGRHSDNPFFLFINYLEPHLDYQPPKEFTEQFLPPDTSYEEAMEVPQEPWEFVAGSTDISEDEFELLQALYRAEIAYLDEQIGELIQTLKSTGEWEDTVFIVVGDHGENIGDHGLMDHQYSVHDTLLHVPLIIHGGEFNGTDSTDQLVQTLDLFPTMLEIAGVSTPEHIQGEAITPERTDEEREYVYAEYLSPQPTVERLSEQTGVDQKKLESYDKELKSIQSSRYKLIRDSTGDIQLFDLQESPTEQTDISQSDIETSEKLEEALDKWLDSFEEASVNDSVEMSQSTKQKLEDLGYLQ